jgi:hypothetical protein
VSWAGGTAKALPDFGLPGPGAGVPCPWSPNSLYPEVDRETVDPDGLGGRVFGRGR